MMGSHLFARDNEGHDVCALPQSPELRVVEGVGHHT